MKGIIGMHRFNICLVVVLLWCENTIMVLAGLGDYDLFGPWPGAILAYQEGLLEGPSPYGPGWSRTCLVPGLVQY